MARIVSLNDIGVGKPQPWSIDGALSGTTLLWGEPGIGKSFVAMSMAVSIASGRPWIGHKVKQGAVVYVAGEGGEEAVGLRLRTALFEWQIDLDDEYDRIEVAPIHVVTPGVNLVPGPSELTDLIGLEPEIRPRLIVIDTLSRCFIGDENKQDDMGRFVRSLDLLRHHYESDLLVIHHANRQHEIRGSSVLFGAADVSWHLSKADKGDASLVMKADKLRERAPDASLIRLRSQSKPIVSPWGQVYNELGDIQTTLVIKPTKSDLQSAESVAEIGLSILNAGDRLTYTGWHASAAGIGKSQFDTALSFILTYPGKWGIMRGFVVGTFVKAVEDEENVW